MDVWLLRPQKHNNLGAYDIYNIGDVSSEKANFIWEWEEVISAFRSKSMGQINPVS
jgi:hypothetical protein